MSIDYVKKQKARRVCGRHGHHAHRCRLRFGRAKVRRIRAISHASSSPPSQRAPLNSPDHRTRRRSQLRQLRLTRSTCPLRFPRFHHAHLHHLLLWPLRAGDKREYIAFIPPTPQENSPCAPPRARAPERCPPTPHQSYDDVKQKKSPKKSLKMK